MGQATVSSGVGVGIFKSPHGEKCRLSPSPGPRALAPDNMCFCPQIHMKTMPAAMYRLLTAQEQPVYI